MYNVTVSKNSTMGTETLFTYDRERSFLFGSYGSNVTYDENMIYGQVYHSEIYKPFSLVSKERSLMRVWMSLWTYLEGELRLLPYALAGALHSF